MPYRQIRVLVLRHGERSDEVQHIAKSIKSEADHFDPLLTSRGYEQARDAMIRIYSVLRNRAKQTSNPLQVGVFCSPTRRTIGTALMLTAASSGDSNGDNISWQFRSPASSRTPPTPIPIVVLNGLCACTSRIQRDGGSLKVIQQGRLPCAAPYNANAIGNSFLQHISSMQKSVSGMSFKSQPTTKGKEKFLSVQYSFVTSTSTDSSSAAASHSFVPIIPPVMNNRLLPESSDLLSTSACPSLPAPSVTNDLPITGQNHQAALELNQKHTSSTLKCSRRDVLYGNHESRWPAPEFHQAIDDAVLLAANVVECRNETNNEKAPPCDVIVVVAHRETIRSLMYERCINFPQHMQVPIIPYCCIGSFIATIESNETQHIVKWHIHSAKEYHSFADSDIP
jgi:broad specificity phosphatase PhoE